MPLLKNAIYQTCTSLPLVMGNSLSNKAFCLWALLRLTLLPCSFLYDNRN